MAKKAKAKKSKSRKVKKAVPKKAVRKAAAPKKKAKKAKKVVVRAVAGMAAPPPYRCVHTPQDGVCLRFNLNPATGRYDLPPGGIRVSCDECQHF
jgi:hypothetical protein